MFPIVLFREKGNIFGAVEDVIVSAFVIEMIIVVKPWISSVFFAGVPSDILVCYITQTLNLRNQNVRHTPPNSVHEAQIISLPISPQENSKSP